VLAEIITADKLSFKVYNKATFLEYLL